MTSEELRLHTVADDAAVSCTTCEACCCRLEVLLDDDRGIPPMYTAVDAWGGLVMRRLEDGWCAALDRNTLRCTIYNQRPRNCRDFELGSQECLDERAQMTDASRH